MRMLGRVLTTIGVAIAAVMMIGALLYVVDADEGNVVVGTILDIGRFLADPFRSAFELDNNDVQLPLNWGIGAAIYLGSALALARGARIAADLWGSRRPTTHDHAA